MAAPPALSANAAAPKPDPSVVDQMRSTADGRVKVRANPATGEVGFVRAAGANADLLPDVAADSRAEAAAKADAYLDEFAVGFGAAPGQLKRTPDVAKDQTGWTFTYAQDYRGVPVFGAELHAHVDQHGSLTSVNGYVAPDISIGTSPKVSEADARARALALVESQPSGYEDGTAPAYTGGLEVRSIELMVYRTGSTRGIDGDARLAWVAEVWNEATIRETLILDATTNKPLNRWSMIAHALDRELYEAYVDDNGTPDDPDDDFVGGLDEPVWAEGDPFPADLDEDQQNEVLATGESYWMFRNTFGYNAWDGTGGKMITVNNDPRISCPNANWNGVTTNYCSGVTGDDTVAHEWGHAYTESTSGLIYQWQAGAMNEAYSDIWGEVVDMKNERHNELGEDGDAGGAVLREAGKCSEFTRAEVTMEITAPASVAGPCTAAPASFGPVITQAGVTGTAVVAADAANEEGPSTTDGCSPFDNAAAVAGNWAYVDRGTCPFVQKTQNAVDAGALGIVVGDSVAGRPPVSMPGTAEIYGVMVTNEDGAKFKSAGEPVTFEIAAVPADTDESYRWLSGENDPAFGGAIRDMWNPNCYGDPGKVSDAEYHCAADDSGGVHTNSGVVNRTFAILVDGLPGVVEPIGMDKAAWLFWYSQYHFLTPTSFFPDLADALEASCTALTGADIEKITLGDPTEADGSDGGVGNPEVIQDGMTAADCASVTAAIAETELRLDPTEQCDWQPLLQPGAPSLECGDGTSEEVSFSEDFEGDEGLAGWTLDEEFVYNDNSLPWEQVFNAPEHSGGTAFSPDPTTGQCDGGPNDLTSRTGLVSPDLTVPDGESPRLSFDHYVATEAEWDGANVKVSVDGGEFELVPAEAYLYNAPGGHLDPEQGGPMAGEEAWTGTDGGELGGSWGTSIIDLSAIADAGQTVNFRFDLGRDGCNGVEGWYIDNVTVASCVDDAAEQAPTTTKFVSVKPDPIKKGKPFTVRVKVSSPDATPNGKVVLKKGTTKLGSATLENGVAVIKVTKSLPLGKNKLVASYLGNASFEASKDTFTVKVVR
ncbi:Zn-dependent metalloprotease [Nocardioides thalensis]|uniref:Zn-dependent metalloprotease n=1 Tax=Nocardioides thalensis TaxID=1914755 RepID=A0A853C5A0_9ACTN|nr:M4 family metallopeptidase [Nocardioides thalensis]NYJ01698.1 Zn-dependent metalloprotease [Nocardioides thalensis]